MSAAIEARLTELGIKLPAPQPLAVAKTLPALVVERTPYVSGPGRHLEQRTALSARPAATPGRRLS